MHSIRHMWSLTSKSTIKFHFENSTDLVEDAAEVVFILNLSNLISWNLEVLMQVIPELNSIDVKYVGMRPEM